MVGAYLGEGNVRMRVRGDERKMKGCCVQSHLRKWRMVWSLTNWVNILAPLRWNWVDLNQIAIKACKEKGEISIARISVNIFKRFICNLQSDTNLNNGEMYLRHFQ